MLAPGKRVFMARGKRSMSLLLSPLLIRSRFLKLARVSLKVPEPFHPKSAPVPVLGDGVGGDLRFRRPRDGGFELSKVPILPQPFLLARHCLVLHDRISRRQGFGSIGARHFSHCLESKHNALGTPEMLCGHCMKVPGTFLCIQPRWSEFLCEMG